MLDLVPIGELIAFGLVSVGTSLLVQCGGKKRANLKKGSQSKSAKSIGSDSKHKYVAVKKTQPTKEAKHEEPPKHVVEKQLETKEAKQEPPKRVAEKQPENKEAKQEEPPKRIAEKQLETNQNAHLENANTLDVKDDGAQNQTIQISTYVRRGTSAWVPISNVDESEFSMQLRSDDSAIVTT